MLCKKKQNLYYMRKMVDFSIDINVKAFKFNIYDLITKNRYNTMPKH